MIGARPEIPDFDGMPVRWTRSGRRTLSLTLHPEGWLELRSPLRMSRSRAAAFLLSKADWIRSRRERMLGMIPADRSRPDREEEVCFRRKVNQLAAGLAERLPSGARPVSRIVFRSQQTRWGSCSAVGTISINYACSRLPDRLLEYVVAHEVCHLVRMDHSAAFRTLLDALLPDAGMRKRELMQYRIVSPADEAQMSRAELSET